MAMATLITDTDGVILIMAGAILTILITHITVMATDAVILITDTTIIPIIQAEEVLTMLTGQTTDITTPLTIDTLKIILIAERTIITQELVHLSRHKIIPDLKTILQIIIPEQEAATRMATALQTTPEAKITAQAQDLIAAQVPAITAVAPDIPVVRHQADPTEAGHTAEARMVEARMAGAEEEDLLAEEEEDNTSVLF